MTTINLLPWREKKREQEKKQFALLLGFGVIAAVIIVFIINYYADFLINYQTQRNERLKEEISKLDQQILSISQLKKVREALIARMMIVQNLQATRVLTVRVFDEIIKIMPNGVYLYHIDRGGDKVTLQGFAESNTNISQMMRNIEASAWIQQPSLTEIKKNDSKENKQSKISEQMEFNLNFILKPKSAFGENHEKYKFK